MLWFVSFVGVVEMYVLCIGCVVWLELSGIMLLGLLFV